MVVPIRVPCSHIFAARSGLVTNNKVLCLKVWCQEPNFLVDSLPPLPFFALSFIMAEAHRTNRLKTLWLPHQTRNQFSHPSPLESSPILPSPDIPFHSRRDPYPRSSEHQLMPAKLVQMNKDRPQNLTITRNGNSLPLSPSFDSEDETAAGEPLIQDFATRSIPKEYKPFTAKDSDTNSLDLPMQRPLAVVISEDDDEPRIKYSRSEAQQYPTRSSRFVCQLIPEHSNADFDSEILVLKHIRLQRLQ